MFLDSDSNQNISSLNDGEFLNHPGFLGGTWFKDITNPKGAESDRYKTEEARQKADCDYAAGDSCVDLQECKNFFQDIYNSNTGNSRVPKRKRKAATYHKGKVVSFMNARDCRVNTTVDSSIDAGIEEVAQKNEELEKIREQLTQLGKDSAAASERTFQEAQALINRETAKADKEKKNLMIGAGALVGIMLLVLVLKK